MKSHEKQILVWNSSNYDAYLVPRSLLKEFFNKKYTNAGIYILIGHSKNSFEKLSYIGQSIDLSSRLMNHDTYDTANFTDVIILNFQLPEGEISNKVLSFLERNFISHIGNIPFVNTLNKLMPENVNSMLDDYNLAKYETLVNQIIDDLSCHVEISDFFELPYYLRDIYKPFDVFDVSTGRNRVIYVPDTSIVYKFEYTVGGIAYAIYTMNGKFIILKGSLSMPNMKSKLRSNGSDIMKSYKDCSDCQEKMSVVVLKDVYKSFSENVSDFFEDDGIQVLRKYYTENCLFDNSHFGSVMLLGKWNSESKYNQFNINRYWKETDMTLETYKQPIY